MSEHDDTQHFDAMVRKATEFLETVKCGEVKGFAVAMVKSEGAVVTGWECNSDKFVMLGAISLLGHEFMNTEIEPR
jgi:hypothetical protein